MVLVEFVIVLSLMVTFTIIKVLARRPKKKPMAVLLPPEKVDWSAYDTPTIYQKKKTGLNKKMLANKPTPKVDWSAYETPTVYRKTQHINAGFEVVS